MADPRPTVREARMIKPKLQVSNGYDLDLSPIGRLLQSLTEKRPARWSQAAAGEAIGIPARAVESWASLTAAAGLIRPRTARLTPLGALLAAADPYLGGPLVPWVLHYNLGSNPRNLIWSRMVNGVLPGREALSPVEARAAFVDLEQTHSAYSSRAHLSKELRTFFRAYVEGPLAPLAERRASVRGGHRSPWSSGRPGSGAE